MLYVVVVEGDVIFTTPAHAEAIAAADQQTDTGATVYQLDGHPVHVAKPTPPTTADRS